MSTAFATIPNTPEVVDSPISNKDIAALETTRVLFCAIDAITDAEKHELPFKAFGGMYLPHIQTLKANKFMLYRCQFTALETKRIGEWDNMLSPEGRKNWERSFEQTIINADGRATPKTISGFMQSVPEATAEGEFKLKRSSHIVFNKRYPGTDALKAVKRSQPHGVGGVVEITALAGSTKADRYDAQLFFFPDWGAIMSGDKALPEGVKELREMFQSRIDAIKSQDWSPEKKSKYFSIGQDMLRSCTEYLSAAASNAQLNETILKDAATKGHSGAFIPQSVRKQLANTNLKLRDDLVSGESSSVDRLADIMVKREQSESALEQEKMALKARELLIEEVKLGIRNPDGTLKVATPVTEGNAQIESSTGNVYYQPSIADEPKLPEQESISVGQHVQIGEDVGEVIAKPFGRFKVKIGEEERMVNRDEITAILPM